MTPSTQPPEETFCLTCGPDAVLERRGGAVLHCLRCGTREPVPDFPLFVVTGARPPGLGRTSRKRCHHWSWRAYCQLDRPIPFGTVTP